MSTKTMSNEANLVYSVQQDEYAYSTTGQIGTQFLSPCVAFIILFSDHTVVRISLTDRPFFTLFTCYSFPFLSLSPD